MGETLEVQSEIYEEEGFNKNNLLPNKNCILFVQFLKNFKNEECDKIGQDEDGDLLLTRKQHSTIEVECSSSTPLGLVGLQLWRGAFVLADFILSDPENFSDKVVLEIGSGIGFTSIVAGMYAKEVICTDLDTGGILDLIRKNIHRNEKHLKSEFSVLPLDFKSETYSVELSKKLEAVDIILAADVVYDNDLTEAFLKTVIKLLDASKKKKFYMALEKRYVFTIADLETVAPCYEHFLSLILKNSRRSPMAAWKVREVPLNFQQSFKYERSQHLVMWEIIT